MQEILVVTTDRAYIAPHLALGRWHMQSWGAYWFALLEPKARQARAILRADANLHLVPSLWEELPAAAVTFLQAVAPTAGVAAGDTVAAARLKLASIGLHLCDPRI